MRVVKESGCTVVPKVWGEERVFVSTPDYTFKVLHIKPGFVCSRHRHPRKIESFICEIGNGVIEVNGSVFQVRPQDVVHIPQNTWHCFASAIGMTLFEVSTEHSDADVVRENESHKLSQEMDPAIWEILYR